MANWDYDRNNADRRDTRSRLFEGLDDPMNDYPTRDHGERDSSSRRRAPVEREKSAYDRYSAPKEDYKAFPDYPGNGNVTIYSPKSYADVQDMIENLRRGESIIVNLEGIESESAQRILDFLSGASYGLGGSMRRVKEMNSTFLVTPQGTGITDTNDDRYTR